LYWLSIRYGNGNRYRLGKPQETQALDTIYDLVWEGEFKNILNVGRIWLKFKKEDKPFGIPLRDKRTHSKISLGDIIQIDRAYYMVNSVGARKVRLVD
jgi:DNA helicase TIP49 (TBP-interacting protein)